MAAISAHTPIEFLQSGAQAQKSERMREAILSTAVSRLAELGYHAISIKKIAAAGDFSIGALQHHFPTKLDLMAAVVDRALERAENYVRRWRKEGGGSGIAALVEASWQDQIQSDWYLAMLEVFVAARTDESLRQRIAPSILEYGHATEGRIAGMVAGNAAGAEASFLLAVSRCMMGGLLVQDALALPRAEAARFVARWAEFVEQSLGSGGTNDRR